MCVCVCTFFAYLIAFIAWCMTDDVGSRSGQCTGSTLGQGQWMTVKVIIDFYT